MWTCGMRSGAPSTTTRGPRILGTCTLLRSKRSWRRCERGHRFCRGRPSCALVCDCGVLAVVNTNVGARFGRLTVIAMVGRWRDCRCDCGAELSRTVRDLRRDKAHMCGTCRGPTPKRTLPGARAKNHVPKRRCRLCAGLSWRRRPMGCPWCGEPHAPEAPVAVPDCSSHDAFGGRSLPSTWSRA